jgi:hypothetical protein
MNAIAKTGPASSGKTRTDYSRCVVPVLDQTAQETADLLADALGAARTVFSADFGDADTRLHGYATEDLESALCELRKARKAHKSKPDGGTERDEGEALRRFLVVLGVALIAWAN